MNKKYIKSTLATAALAVAAIALVNADEHNHDHDHGGKKAGPNGGRVLHEVEPHLEFFVTKDRKVQLTALNDKLEAVAIGDQVVKITAGDRQNPIRMSFSKSGNALVSDTAFPPGDDFPVVVQIKTKPGDKTVIEKFTMDFSPCPTCDYLEYACTCDHVHDHDHDHDHKHEKKE
ncbi:MAG: hypothetical protein P1V20_17440 [Verrucomicrobiales bacterium]|nr:hypothetical protein [Verrucomicrobiales bacterium]